MLSALCSLLLTAHNSSLSAVFVGRSPFLRAKSEAFLTAEAFLTSKALAKEGAKVVA